LTWGEYEVIRGWLDSVNSKPTGAAAHSGQVDEHKARLTRIV
jgi:hypothetical protein